MGVRGRSCVPRFAGLGQLESRREGPTEAQIRETGIVSSDDFRCMLSSHIVAISVDQHEKEGLRKVRNRRMGRRAESGPAPVVLK